MFTETQRNAISKEAEALGVEYPALQALINVESNGQVFATVGSKQMPLIRWEGHYFDRLINPSKRATARAQGLSSPVAQGIPNPSKQPARYAILDKAKKLDVEAAIMSCSWGFAQIMGSHAKDMGYSNAQAFEKVVTSGFNGQLEVFIKFIKMSGIIPHLKRKDWSAVARIYNGKNYKKFKYDEKLATEYKKLSGFKSSPSSSGMLRAGSKGAAVKEAQSLLKRAGYVVEVDSDYGPETEAAVRKFQASHQLEVDGVIGPLTKAKLYAYKQTDSEELGITTVAENPKTVQGLVGGIGGAIGIETINNKIDLWAEKTTGMPGLEYLTSGLTAVSILVGVVGVVYGIYQFYKSNKTELGTS